MRIIIVLLCMLTFAATQAQNDSTKQRKKSCTCGISNITQLGVLQGEHKSAVLLQNITGFRYKTWFAGVGAGLDYYHIRGIPVFLDIRKDILQKNSSPFVYTDIGVHFGWGEEKDEYTLGDISYKNGLYYDVGIGYRAATRNKNSGFVFSAGYSYKNVIERRNSIAYCPFAGPCVESINRYDYDLRRLSLKIGWQF